MCFIRCLSRILIPSCTLLLSNVNWYFIEENMHMYVHFFIWWGLWAIKWHYAEICDSLMLGTVMRFSISRMFMFFFSDINFLHQEYSVTNNCPGHRSTDDGSSPSRPVDDHPAAFEGWCVGWCVCVCPHRCVFMHLCMCRCRIPANTNW